eukprot:COSAG01_NODE_3463_length_6066_cov_2.711916_4_plen_71_part_00
MLRLQPSFRGGGALVCGAVRGAHPLRLSSRAAALPWHLPTRAHVGHPIDEWRGVSAVRAGGEVVIHALAR